MIYQKYNYFEEDDLIYLNLLRNFSILSIEKNENKKSMNHHQIIIDGN